MKLISYEIEIKRERKRIKDILNKMNKRYVHMGEHVEYEFFHYKTHNRSRIPCLQIDHKQQTNSQTESGDSRYSFSARYHPVHR